MKNYETVSDAASDLTGRNYNRNFNIVVRKKCLVCNKSGLVLSTDGFEINEVHRFETKTDPGNEMFVFAFSNKYLSAKGVLVNAYGIYTDLQTSLIVQQLNKHL
ncbi:MAG: phosphoribosylpyrophosphate synthetase [Bacteroidota bacterium]